MSNSSPSTSARDAFTILGWLAFTVGALLAVGWGYGLMVVGLGTVLLALFGMKE